MVDPPNPMTALTLAEMHLAGWEVRAKCNRCKVELRADLKAMIRVYGPDAIWWGRKPKCPGFDCAAGELVYSARAIPSGSWVLLTRAPDPRTVETWRARRRVWDRGTR